MDPQRAQSSTDVWVPKDADAENLRDEGKYIWVSTVDGGSYIWIPKDNKANSDETEMRKNKNTARPPTISPIFVAESWGKSVARVSGA